MKQQVQADSGSKGAEAQDISEQLSNLTAWVYFSVFVILIVFAIVAGLIWVLWSQGKKIRQLNHKLGHFRKKLEKLSKSASTKGDPQRKASRVSRNEKRELQNEIIEMKKRLEKIERNSEFEEHSKKEGGSVTDLTDFTDVESEPKPEAEEEDEGAASERGAQNFPTRSFHERKRSSVSGGRLEKDFNRVENGKLRQKKFEEEHDPVRLGIQNEEERLNDENAPVLLHRDDRGQYLAVEEDSGYLVVPKFDVILQDADRREAGFDEVFGCGGAPYNHPYEIQRVEKAAQLNQSPNGTFVLEEPGQIHLQRYD